MVQYRGERGRFIKNPWPKLKTRPKLPFQSPNVKAVYTTPKRRPKYSFGSRLQQYLQRKPASSLKKVLFNTPYSTPQSYKTAVRRSIIGTPGLYRAKYLARRAALQTLRTGNTVFIQALKRQGLIGFIAATIAYNAISTAFQKKKGKRYFPTT